MRRLVLPLVLAGLALASATLAAPAPLLRRDREPPNQKQRRLLDEHSRKLLELGVKWHVADGARGKSIRFNVRHPDGNSAMGGDFLVYNGDVPGALQRVIRRVEAFLTRPHPF
jgi:hypothetical protein